MNKVDQLIEVGQLEDAALLLTEEGQFDQAIALYEKIWNYSQAVHTCILAKDFPRALKNALRSKDAALVEVVVRHLTDQPKNIAGQCAKIAEERNNFILAGQLWIQAEDMTLAAHAFVRAKMHLEAARLFDHLGEINESIRYYKTYLDENINSKEESEAALELGRLLIRQGQNDDAIIYLQKAFNPLLQDVNADSDIRAKSASSLSVAFYRRGFKHAAHRILELAQSANISLPQLEELLEDPRLCLEEQNPQQIKIAGRYQLGELLGSGGMGRVYHGYDLIKKQNVAIKVFSPPSTKNGREAYLRFIKEAKITGSLSHPHIVDIYQFNDDQGFIVFEYLNGGTLADRNPSEIDLSFCRKLMLELIDALSIAHQRGVVHRDIKPANIFFDQFGAAKLGDFGVAHLQDSTKTQTGSFIGTLAFMSPEQILGEEISFATDIYALGVTLYWMCTAKLPFEAPGIVRKHLYELPQRPSSIIENLPAICDQTILKALEKKPADRFSSLTEFKKAIEAFPKTKNENKKQEKVVEREDKELKTSTSKRFQIHSKLEETEHYAYYRAYDEKLSRDVEIIDLYNPSEKIRHILSIASHAVPYVQTILSLSPKNEPALKEDIILRLILAAYDSDAIEKTEKALTQSNLLALARSLQPFHQANIPFAKLEESIIVINDEVSLRLLPMLKHYFNDPQKTTIATDLKDIERFSGLELSPFKSAEDLVVALESAMTISLEE